MSRSRRNYRNGNRENEDLNHPTDHANTDCTPRARVVKGLSDGDHHRYEHPYARDKKEQGAEAWDDP